MLRQTGVLVSLPRIPCGYYHHAVRIAYSLSDAVDMGITDRSWLTMSPNETEDWSMNIQKYLS